MSVKRCGGLIAGVPKPGDLAVLTTRKGESWECVVVENIERVMQNGLLQSVCNISRLKKHIEEAKAAEK